MLKSLLCKGNSINGIISIVDKREDKQITWKSVSLQYHQDFNVIQMQGTQSHVWSLIWFRAVIKATVFLWLNFLLCLQTCLSVIQVTCVLVSDDLWKEKMKKTNCVGGCRCCLRFMFLSRREKKCFCPHINPVWMLSLF